MAQVEDGGGTKGEALSCKDKVLKYEKLVCATGTAWGLLEGYSTGVLAFYWAVRHAIYAAAAVGLILAFGEDAFAPVVAFFFVVHAYKLARFLSAPDPDQKVKDLETGGVEQKL